MQTVGGHEPLDGELGRFYDAIENPRSIRNELPLLRGAELRDYMEQVRERALEVLERTEIDDTDDRLLQGGFAFDMLAEHERQHQETMLQLLQMVDGYPCPGRDPATAELPVAEGPEMVTVAAGLIRSAAAGRASPTTTSVRSTRLSSMSSRSIACRSATRSSPHSSPRPASRRRCTGNRTAGAAG